MMAKPYVGGRRGDGLGKRSRSCGRGELLLQIGNQDRHGEGNLLLAREGVHLLRGAVGADQVNRVDVALEDPADAEIAAPYGGEQSEKGRSRLPRLTPATRSSLAAPRRTRRGAICAHRAPRQRSAGRRCTGSLPHCCRTRGYSPRPWAPEIPGAGPCGCNSRH